MSLRTTHFPAHSPPSLSSCNRGRSVPCSFVLGLQRLWRLPVPTPFSNRTLQFKLSIWPPRYRCFPSGILSKWMSWTLLSSSQWKSSSCGMSHLWMVPEGEESFLAPSLLPYGCDIDVITWTAAVTEVMCWGWQSDNMEGTWVSSVVNPFSILNLQNLAGESDELG